MEKNVKRKEIDWTLFINQSKAELERLEEEAKRAQQELEEANQQKIDKEKNLAKLDKEIKDKKDAVNDLNKQLSDLWGKIDNENSNLAKLAQERKKEDEEFEKYINEKGELKKSIDLDYEKAKQETELKMKLLQDEMKKIQDEKVELDIVLNNLQKDIRESQDTKTFLEKAIIENKAYLDGLTESIITKTSLDGELNDKLEAKRTEIEDMETEYKTKKDLAAEARKELIKVQSQLEAKQLAMANLLQKENRLNNLIENVKELYKKIGQDINI